MNKNTKYVVGVLAIAVLVIVFLASRPSQNGKTSDVPASVSTQSVTDVTSPSAAVLAGAKNISWKTTNYPKNASVNINLLRKIGDNPRQFTLVRALATDTPNDGQETWIPQAGEKTNDLYIEVTCSTTYKFTAGCSLSTDPTKVN